MLNQMIEMLVDKRMQEITTEQLIEDKREDLINETRNNDVLSLFREEFPEYCAPELSEAIKSLEFIKYDIKSSRHHKGRLPQIDFIRWASVIDKAIISIRESAIKLPSN